MIYGEELGAGGISTKTLPPQGLNLTLKGGNGKIDCTFTGITSEWLYLGQYYRLIAKPGSAPTSPMDGVQVKDVQVGAIGDAVISASIEGLTNGVQYYVRLYVRGENGWQTSVDAVGTATPMAYATYGVRIDQSNPDPEASVTYTDGAVGMTGGSADWDSMPIFREIKPCLFKDGAVVGYLNPDNFAQFEDGTTADITSGNAGDVMIEFPKTGFKLVTVGDILAVQITDDPNAIERGFHYYGHTREIDGDREKLYIGAYLTVALSGKLYTISDRTPGASETLKKRRTQAQAKGTGYDILSFYPLTLIQCLYLIKYKNLNSQVALGYGYVNGSSAAARTGGTNEKGMCFGESGGKLQMKLFGIEDFWGNMRQWIDGLFCDSSFNILTAFQNFNGTGSGYTNRGSAGISSNIIGRLKKVQGTTETGFVAKEVGGSDSTYFSDYARLFAGRLPFFGGFWDSNDIYDAGIFYLNVSFEEANTQSNLGARLMYL